MGRLFRRLVRWVGTKPWFAFMAPYIVTPLDKLTARRGGSLTHWAIGLPVGYLTTVGRLSGEPRVAPLVYVESDDDSTAIVGTNFGGRNHPQWTANLLASPQARWKIEAEVPVVARLATDEEFAELWPRFIALWPGYEDYVSRSRRSPRMFLLDSVS